ncbi:hypothetical protein HQ39_03890 [Porphyromonas sp. COT-108 OH2963]|uniref:phosphatase PAP2 family protein n=1 Tax=Porphyromonas sp. COT-108 OH2963 TaxID=1515614 RepID=UPI00052C93D3|nr:phosphatase PAP2 family protein [Porphyromonas sp. COT-108 OH2963]KGN96099.1 hypothetical protein HQ39_03890 [Porphyromonas sp. COT-108 OH2963]
MIEQLVPLEQDLFLWLNSLHTPYLDGVMYMISDKFPWIFIGVVYLFLVCYKQNYKEVLLLILALSMLILIGDQLSSHIIKPWVGRLRPSHHPLTADLVHTVLDYRGGRYGFISGHSTNFLSFACFTALLWRNRFYSIIAILTGLTVAYSRIYLGVHFITDVIPGIAAGVAIAFLVYAIYIFLRKRVMKLSSQEAKIPYIQPSGMTKVFGYMLLLFYIGLWTVSPILFPLYY